MTEEINKKQVFFAFIFVFMYVLAMNPIGIKLSGLELGQAGKQLKPVVLSPEPRFLAAGAAFPLTRGLTSSLKGCFFGGSWDILENFVRFTESTASHALAIVSSPFVLSGLLMASVGCSALFVGLGRLKWYVSRFRDSMTAFLEYERSMEERKIEVARLLRDKPNGYHDLIQYQLGCMRNIVKRVADAISLDLRNMQSDPLVHSFVSALGFPGLPEQIKKDIDLAVKIRDHIRIILWETEDQSRFY